MVFARACLARERETTEMGRIGLHAYGVGFFLPGPKVHEIGLDPYGHKLVSTFPTTYYIYI